MSRFFYLLTSSLLLATGWATALAQGSPTVTPAQRLNLTLVENRSTFNINAQQNEYVNTLRLSQPGNDNPYKLTAGMLNEGNNYITFTRTDDVNNATEFARINLSAVVTKPKSDLVDYVIFDTDNPPSSNTTITASNLSSAFPNWGTNGSNLIWQTSGYAYISGQGGLTFTVPSGYSNAVLQFVIAVGSNARGGYFAYNLNSEGWYIAASATANYETDFVIDGLNSGDVISFYGVNSSQSSLAASPDFEYIAVFEIPDSFIPTIEVTPTISRMDGENWGEATSLGTSMSYEPNDTIDLYSLGYLSDQFVESTTDNSYPNAYSYKTAFNANVVLPASGQTGTDLYATADFNTQSITGDGTWALNEAGLYYTDNTYTSICAIIDYYGDILFTLPDTFVGNQVTVTVTSCTGDYGARDLYVNGMLHTFTSGTSHTWTVDVSANGTIEFKGPSDTYSVGISSIVISSGNPSSLNAPKNFGDLNDRFNHKAGETKQFSESQKERNKKVIIND